MKKSKNQRGFIQIPILIWVIISVFVGGASVVVYEHLQKKKLEQKLPLNMELPQTSIVNQGGSETQIEELKQKVQELEKVKQVSSKPSSAVSVESPEIKLEQCTTYANVKALEETQVFSANFVEKNGKISTTQGLELFNMTGEQVKKEAYNRFYIECLNK